MVWKLSSVSVVRGSGVGVVLHNRSRFDVGGWGILGSPTRLLERGSSSELLSLGSVNHPLRWAVVVSWVLRPEMEQGFVQAKPVLRLSWFSVENQVSRSFVQVFLLLVLGMPLFKAEDVLSKASRFRLQGLAMEHRYLAYLFILSYESQ